MFWSHERFAGSLNDQVGTATERTRRTQANQIQSSSEASTLTKGWLLLVLSGIVDARPGRLWQLLSHWHVVDASLLAVALGYLGAAGLHRL